MRSIHVEDEAVILVGEGLLSHVTFKFPSSRIVSKDFVVKWSGLNKSPVMLGLETWPRPRGQNVRPRPRPRPRGSWPRPRPRGSWPRPRGSWPRPRGQFRGRGKIPGHKYSTIDYRQTTLFNIRFIITANHSNLLQLSELASHAANIQMLVYLKCISNL